MRVLIVSSIVILSITFSSCFRNKTYLTEKEKSWNPYKKGQILIFESSENIKDTLQIEAIRYAFPDGLGVIEYDQRLNVLTKPMEPPIGKQFSNSFYSLRIFAETGKIPSNIIFSIKIKNTNSMKERFRIEHLQKLPEIELTTKNNIYNDVIVINNKRDYSHVETAIEVIFWSKSKGYVRFDKYNGETWELFKIID